MSGLDDADREDLVAFREACGPSARRRAANWAAIQERVAAESSGRSRLVRPAIAALLVAAGILLWVALRPEPTALGRAEPRPSIAVDHRIGADAGYAAERRPSGAAAVDASSRREDDPGPRPEAEPGPPPPRPRTVAPSPGSAPRSGEPGARRRSGAEAKASEGVATAPGSEPASVSESMVRAEAALMDRVRSALQSGRYDEVLRRLGEHRARFAAPFMAEEAAAWRAMALCGLGRVEAGREAAAVFERAYPRSPHGASVRASCREDRVTDPGGSRQEPPGGL